jgi:hypothetical protein
MATANPASKPSEQEDASEREEFRERYPNLAAREDLDRAEHVSRAIQMGATRKQAFQHADEEVGGH